MIDCVLKNEMHLMWPLSLSLDESVSDGGEENEETQSFHANQQVSLTVSVTVVTEPEIKFSLSGMENPEFPSSQV